MQTSSTRFTDKSGFLSVYFNGTSWIGIEPSDLTSASLPSGVTSDPLALITQVLGSSVSIGSKAVGLVAGSLSSDPASANGWTGAADQPSAFGTIRLQDCRTFWSDIETSQGVYNSAAVARLDTMINAAYAAGKDVLFPMYYTPTWASGAGTVYGVPTSMTYVSDFIAWLLARYGNKITHIEGWNEPNVTGSWAGNTAQLVAYQKAIFNAVATYNSANSTSIKVISPGFTFQKGISTSTINFDAFMTAAYADSGSTGYYCDIIGYHFYSETNRLRFDRGCVSALKTNIATHPGASSLELWCTEVGDAAPTARTVIEQIAYCLALGVKRVIVYSWYMYGGTGGDMGLVRKLTPAQFDTIANTFQGKTMTALNGYKTTNINTGGNPQAVGGQLGAVINGQGLLLT